MEPAGLGPDARAVPGGVGAASALKMCYASITKGLTASVTQSLTAAKAYGVDAVDPRVGRIAAHVIGQVRPRPSRHGTEGLSLVAEMEEIARSFADVGLDPQTFLGARRCTTWSRVPG